MKEKTHSYLIKASAIVIAAFFLTSISASGIGLTRIENASKKNDVPKEIISNFADKLIIDYFKVREYPSGSWHTSSITANLGAELEFKLKVKSTRIFGHEFVFVVINLPTINGNPMFDYVEDSASNPGNLLDANDEEVAWCYAHIGLATPRVMSFRAIIAKPGTETVDLTVFSLNPDTSGDPSTGSIQVTGINQPPTIPSTPSGPTSGYIYEYYEYSTSASDPEGHSVRYYFNWGDGTGDLTEWVNSGGASSCSHRWDKPGTYYVKAKAQDEYYAESDWSGTLPVNILNHPPNVPSNPSPDDGETDVDVNANLSWIGGDPDSYDYVVYDVYFEADDPTPDELVSDDQIDTSYDPGGMQEGTTYYWQIIAKDNHGATTSGPIWHFTTPNNPPYPPSNPNPADGETGVDINANLNWTGGDPDPGNTVTYDIYFGITSPPPQVVGNQSNITYNPGPMNYNTTYYWEIVAWDNHGASTEGMIWSFTTKVNYPPNQPSNPDPTNGSTNISVDADLSWNCSDPDGHSLTYDVYFEADNPTPNVLVSVNQTETTCDPGTLECETTYYWQIIAEDEFGATTEGPVWHFTTEEEPELPDLDCEGTLSWTGVKPGSIVNGSFTVKNIGEDGSELDWKVEYYPSWGTWTFAPSSGDNLKPEDGAVTVDVSVIAPDEKNKEFTGNITIVNEEDSSDYCKISVSLVTPVNQNTIVIQFLEWMIERFPLLNLMFSVLLVFR